MSKLRRKYTKEEKLEIVKLSLDSNEEIKELATRFDIHPGTIYNWRKSFFEHKDAAFPGKGNKTLTDSEREIAALKKELRETQLERDILKKAVSIFSKTDRKFSNL